MKPEEKRAARNTRDPWKEQEGTGGGNCTGELLGYKWIYLVTYSTPVLLLHIATKTEKPGFKHTRI